MPSGPIFDFNEPKIRVKTNLARNALLDFARIDPLFPVGPSPAALDAQFVLRR